MSRKIPINIERKLYAESMGRCMNPDCKCDLFTDSGNMGEKAHITPHYETADNSFENLIVLCPNCHTNFDKNSTFTQDTVRQWKQLRAEEFESFFGENFSTFDELVDKVKPLLVENQIIFDSYYLGDKKELWDKIGEPKILVNNSLLRKLLLNNLHLIQHSEKHGSHLTLAKLFIAHINEFEATRLDEEKIRQILFPEKINSLFRISPSKSNGLILSVESLEVLISALQKKGKDVKVCLGNDNPYITIHDSSKTEVLYLTDMINLEQYYFTYSCFRKSMFSLESLNRLLKYVISQDKRFTFYNSTNLREIEVNNTKIIFACEYCLSRVTLEQICPEPKSIVVNPYYFNGGSISEEAYSFAKEISVKLLTGKQFYGYINSI